MKLSRITLENFRLLRSASVRMGDSSSSTILVGPNNSGKTSVAEALQLFQGKRAGDFSLNDFSIGCRSAFDTAQSAFLADISDTEEALPTLPAITLTLHFEYADVPEDLAVAADLLMDLDPASRSIALVAQLAIRDTKRLRTAFRSQRENDQSLYEFLSSRLKDYYALSYFKADPAKPAEREALADGAAFDRLLRIDFVGAQRYISDEETSQANRLSRLLHSHYQRRYEVDDPEGHRALDAAVRDHSTDLTGRYRKAFEGLVAGLNRFGYPQRHSHRLSVRAELDPQTLFKDNTRLYYETDLPKPDGSEETPVHELPEKYNGLGFKNLIYMVLKIQSYREDFEGTAGVRPRVQLIIIEEPEVHLHPQMQSVFIRNVAQFLSSKDGQSDAQLLLTTHSSHVVADCGFAPVRYFRRRANEATVKDLLDFQDTAGSVGNEATKFLARYLTQTRCDLLFADKAILVEGAVERLLLPQMIAAVSVPPYQDFQREYVAVLEVGGAYAHLFRTLLEFIELPTLIVTDIDSIAADRKKCRVADGTSSSNATLTKWLPGTTSLADLRAATEEQKRIGSICVTYQIPETSGAPCGRSFEESFIYCNLDWIVAHGATLESSNAAFDGLDPTTLQAQAYSLSTEALGKVDFALDLMLTPGWTTPRYIADGLRWLASQNP